MTNTWDFRSIFPDLRFYFNGFLDIFSNYLCAMVVVIFNFFLLSFNESLIDIVLNSIAALFIIELDDAAVFLSNDSIMDLFKQKLIDEMFDKFSKIPSIYFNNPENKNDTWVYIDSLNTNNKFFLENDENSDNSDNIITYGNNSRILALNTKFYKIDENMEIVRKFQLKFNKKNKPQISQPNNPLRILRYNPKNINSNNPYSMQSQILQTNLMIDYNDAVFV